MAVKDFKRYVINALKYSKVNIQGGTKIMEKKERNWKEKEATLSRKRQLTETQKKVAEEIAYKGFTGKKEEDIAKENNINRTTIWRWKANPLFNEEVNRIVREFQRSHLVDVNNILYQILQEGSEKSKLKAIELYYRNQGLFKDNLQVTETQEINVSVDDILKELEGI
ncbi:TPA: phBC6A51 family helix-turn-helix protein [Clostridium botulinum]